MAQIFLYESSETGLISKVELIMKSKNSVSFEHKMVVCLDGLFTEEFWFAL